MKLTRLFLLLPFLWLGSPALAQTPPPAPEFVIEEGGQSNVFLDDVTAQVHVLLRKERLVFAFPSENSGMGLWFQGGLKIVPGSLRALPGGKQHQEVEVKLQVLQATTIDKVVLDSIRTLRDESEGAGTAAKITKARATLGKDGAETVRTTKDTTVSFERQQRYVPAEAGAFRLDLTPARVQGDKVTLLPGEVVVRARLPFPAMTAFTAKELYRPEFLKVLRRAPKRINDSLISLEFLTRREKMMAGSWRFLTYFGRDTLISLAMLEPILSDEAMASGVRSVLDRLADNGMVAHEEDIGPWAEWRHLQAGEEGSLDPVYDHKMVDDDLLLPVLLAKLQENGRGAVVQTLLADRASREKVVRNADYVFDLLARQQKVRLNPGESTGDWRDSHEGLGGGVFPASINSDLALPALDALTLVYGSLPTPDTDKLERLKALRPVWEKIAESYWVELNPSQVKERLQAFGKTLSAEQKKGYDRLLAARPDLLEKPFRFPVLSYRDDGSAVVVPHTDVAFTLFYGHPDEQRLGDIVSLLERPFPYGLATPGGLLIASPVFSPEPGHARSLGFGQYHGLVVWSWPSAMMQFGLLRQQGRFPALEPRIAGLLQGIKESEARVGPLATSELWAIGLDDSGITWRAYGVAGDQAESNAMQLWSTVYPALDYVRRAAAEKE